ncbi:hypothetical protein BGZ98_010296 [Dissophora globulifera]|nr:hypothetical protein BGZ98_010296 [Dissophora globulifera]
MPAGYILSANYLVSTNFTQVTGCIDSSKWGQNPTDDGGQMDSHGWPYSCVGFKKFVSLIEPATNTYCLRCCNADNNIDCNTSISTKGCWNVIPGTYAMADGSVCKPPTGSANSTTTNGVPIISGTPAAPAPTGSAPITNPPVAGSNGGTKSGSGSNTGSNTVKTSAAGRASSSFEFLGAAAAVAVAVAASF